MGLLLFATLIGAAAGLGAWALLEPFAPGLAPEAAWSSFETIFSLVMGGIIGGAIGGLNGWNQGSKVHMFRGILIGAIAASIIGFIGFQFGGRIATAFTHGSVSDSATIPRMLGRMIAFSFFGAGIGAGLGASGRSFKRLWVGALGGFVGGLVAGVLFDPISAILSPIVIATQGGLQSVGPDGIPRTEQEVGGPGRATLGAIMGGSIGLFTSLFLLATKSAWVRLVLGRNEGKEWIIDAPVTMFGRSESAHVPLFGDQNVAPNHAVIERRGAQYILKDLGTPLGTGVNGQRISEFALFDGAQIQIGTHTLIFMMKDGVAKRAAQESTRGWNVASNDPTPQTHGPMSGHAPSPTQQGATQQFPPPPGSTMQQTQVVAPQPGPAGSYFLVFLDGPRAGERIPVIGLLEVGRESTGIALPTDPAISRRHAVVTPTLDGVSVKDLGSTNGTFHNGARINEATIRPGDLVRMGSTTFRVERQS